MSEEVEAAGHATATAATQAPPSSPSSPSLEWPRTLLLVNAAALAVLLVLTLLSLILTISLSADVGRLEEQSRRATRAVKALEEETLALHERLAAREKEAKAAEAPRPPPVPRNIDAADPANDCVIRPGKGGIAQCL